MDFKIREATERDRTWILEKIRSWGADFVVTRGRKVYAAELPAFLAEDARGQKVGLLTYEIIEDQCEVVTLDAFVQFSGIGTALMRKCEAAARAAGCRRLWLITTNDNLDAIRFYQRRGMTIAAIHVNALAHSRKLKPSIPEVAPNGISLRDEIEFEMML
jgi:N-acetylglutamate synthase-like GNAT family acetyltransferase